MSADATAVTCTIAVAVGNGRRVCRGDAVELRLNEACGIGKRTGGMITSTFDVSQYVAEYIEGQGNDRVVRRGMGVALRDSTPVDIDRSLH